MLGSVAPAVPRAQAECSSLLEKGGESELLGLAHRRAGVVSGGSFGRRGRGWELRSGDGGRDRDGEILSFRDVSEVEGLALLPEFEREVGVPAPTGMGVDGA